MATTSGSGLKNNPSQTLLHDKEDMLLVTLFQEGNLSLTQAAKLSNMTLAGFITHVSKLGIPVINQTDSEVEDDMDTLDKWLNQ